MRAQVDNSIARASPVTCTRGAVENKTAGRLSARNGSVWTSCCAGALRDGRLRFSNNRLAMAWWRCRVSASGGSDDWSQQMSARKKGTAKKRIKKSGSATGAKRAKTLSKTEARKQSRARFAGKAADKQDTDSQKRSSADSLEKTLVRNLRSPAGPLSLLPATFSLPIPPWRVELQKRWSSGSPSLRRKAIHLLEKAATEPDVEKCLALLQKALVALGFDEIQICHLVVGLYHERLVTVREEAIVDVCDQVCEAVQVFKNEAEPQEKKTKKTSH